MSPSCRVIELVVLLDKNPYSTAESDVQRNETETIRDRMHFIIFKVKVMYKDTLSY